jgi:MoxR-like ATPase
MKTPASNPEQLAKAGALAQAMRREVRKAVVGQEAVIDQVLAALFAGGHVLVEGVPGLGKTLLVRALARSFRGEHRRIQFTPDLMPSDVAGHAMFELKSEDFRIRKGPIFGNLILADEINRAPAKTQAALLEAMQERQVTIEGQGLPLPHPFLVMATQNPVEQEGTYPLPEAQLDRFLLKIAIDYPGETEEQALVRQVTEGRVADDLQVEAVQAVATPEDVLDAQQAAGSIRVDDAVVAYAVRIARATRDWPGLAMGAGPRGGIALVRAARAVALMDGRDFITPDDVKAMAIPALRHRVTPSPESEIEGHGPDVLLGALLERVEAPRA